MTWRQEDKEGVQQEFEYEMHVSNSYAGFTEYNQGNTPLQILEGEKVFSNGKRQEDHMWLTVGDFEPTDGGKRWIHTSGDAEKRFSAQSKYQKFIKSALEAGVPLEETGEDSLDAGMWAGLSFKVVEKEEKSVIAGEERTWRQPLVTAYLGGDVAGGNVSASGGVSGAASGGMSENGGGPSEAEVADLMKEFKGGGKEHIDFLAEATKRWGLRVTDPRLSEDAWARV